MFMASNRSLGDNRDAGRAKKKCACVPWIMQILCFDSRYSHFARTEGNCTAWHLAGPSADKGLSGRPFPLPASSFHRHRWLHLLQHFSFGFVCLASHLGGDHGKDATAALLQSPGIRMDFCCRRPKCSCRDAWPPCHPATPSPTTSASCCCCCCSCCVRLFSFSRNFPRCFCHFRGFFPSCQPASLLGDIFVI